MKKFFLALSILSVVPYSTTSCSQNGGGNGLDPIHVLLIIAAVGTVGKYGYNYFYPTTTPANQPVPNQQQSDNNSTELPTKIQLEKETTLSQPLSFEDKGSFEKPQNDAPKLDLLVQNNKHNHNLVLEQPKTQSKPNSNDMTKGTQPKAPVHAQKPVPQVLEPKKVGSNPDFWNTVETHLRKSARQSQTEKFKENPFDTVFD